VPQISALELADLAAGRSGPPEVLVVDVRSEQERMISSVPGARAIHLDDFRSGAAVRLIPFDRPVVIFCRTGVRAQEAARILIEAGHPDVRNLQGGVLAWVRDIDPSQPTY
jgi:adenylyltransferase/sulfurtransferase